MNLRGGVNLIFLISVVALITLSSFVIANYYVENLYFTVPSTVFTTGSQIGLKGYLFEANYTDNGTVYSSSTAAISRTINITIMNKSNNVTISNYTFNTDQLGAFYSNSTYYYNYTTVSAPLAEGDYIIRAQYIDGNSSTWRSDVDIRVVNQTVSELEISSASTTYNPSDTVYATIEAKTLVSDKIKFISNVSVNGSLRNSTKGILQSFNCTTGSNGKCQVSLTAPSTYGYYVLEVLNYKSFSTFSVIPFTANVYMKDELGKSYKNTFALGESASVEASVVDNASTSSYNFSGYIASSSGSVVKTINSTLLNATNSYTNKFTFAVSSSEFSYGTYYVNVVVQKSNGNNITLKSSFQVDDWQITMSKKSALSGFEYEYSSFPNVTLRLEAYPKYRVNGSVVPNISSTAFSINLTDSLDNTLLSPNASWNGTCGKEGCYEITFTAPVNTGQYSLKAVLSYNGETQKVSRTIHVVNRILQAQSTDSEGNIKELFGASDAVYFTMSAYNKTVTNINVSNLEIFTVSFMNGTEMNYTNVSTFAGVNLSNSILEWSVNETPQRIKMDAPKFGGVYDALVLAENRTIAAVAKFIVNPYDVCASPKNAPGSTLSSGSGQYYISQFKTTDTVYFQLKVIQASNPLGKASVSNFSSNGSNNGMGSACSVNTQTQQAVNNATVSVVSVTNTQNGVTYALNTSSSVCATLDSSGGYECTIQPAVKWDGGTYSALMRITGPDGQTQDQVYGFFEARAFYVYGWSQTWQNQPLSNITLTVQMYEAGRNWWSSYGSGGLSGTVSVEKVEYQGSDGEWIWPPISYAYNTSAVNSSTLTTGQGTITLPAANAPAGSWKAGYYRAILKGTDSNGNTDYGYAWFGVRRWSAYGSPIECGTSGCNYKSYFNSRENISLYVQISPATDYSYSYSGGQNLGGNITIRVKKLQDCRSWPCTEINSTFYSATSIVVNQSNAWYWNMNGNNSKNYTIYINRTSGFWGTGYYSVVLDINGSETGNGWFNTIAFYVDAVPTNNTGTTGWSHYDIKNNDARYYNVSTIKNYKGWGSSYNISDYLNTTITALTLNYWDESTYQSKALVYPTHISLNSTVINGNALVNITYNGSSWPTGWYWGQLTVNNSAGETSAAWLNFGVQPFRVQTSTSTYQLDTTTCVNATITVYEPTWAYNQMLTGNYTISEVYENIWNGGGSTRTAYTNYTNTSFANETNKLICPNNGRWSSGSWGGYHYLNLVVKDMASNLTKNGWLSFQSVPFSVSWGSVIGGSAKMTSENVNVSVTVRSGTNNSQSLSGNLTRIYQWRSGGGGWGGREEYNFTVQANGSTSACNSWQASTGCKINGSTTVTINAPSQGWNVGSNYLYAEWSEVTDATSTVQDYYGIYIDGRDPYSGYWNNVDANGNWKYYFNQSENLTIKLNVRNATYGDASANISSVQYAAPSTGCYDEWCKSYTTATYSLVSGTQINNVTGGIIRIHKGSANWTLGEYYIKVTVTGSQGTSTIRGGRINVKDFAIPNITISSPAINSTYNGTTLSISATTGSKTSTCYFNIIDYDRFYSWYCGSYTGGGNSSNSTNSTTPNGIYNSCNLTKYPNYNGSYYRWEYISRDYRSITSGSNYTYWSQSSSTGLSTDSTSHSYTLNLTYDPTSNTTYRAQYYALQTNCYDNNYNYASAYSAFKINVSGS